MPINAFSPAPAVPAQRAASEPLTPMPVVATEAEDSQKWWSASDLGDDFTPEPTPEPVRRPQGLPDNSYWNTQDGCYRVRYGKYAGWYLTPGYDPSKPDLHDGDWKPRQRVTTFIKKVEGGDSFGLDRYKIIHALVGVLLNPSLMGEAMPLALEYKDKQFLDEDTYKSQNKLWNPLIEAAHEMSGGNRGSKNGKVLHYCTEMVDGGKWTIDDVPLRWRKHIEAYIELRDGRGNGPGFGVDSKWIERVCDPDPRYGIDGTFDRLVQFQAPDSLIDEINRVRANAINPEDPDGRRGLPPIPYETEPRWTVMDVKSGDVDYDRNKFGRQMAVYSQAQAVWNYQESCYEELPDNVNRDYCLVVSVPWWESDPTAELLAVPFVNAAGEYGVAMCADVRDLPTAPKLRTVSKAKAPEPVTQQVEEAGAVNTEEAPVKKVSTRKCGTCGQAGHTARSCSADAVTAPEEETRAAVLIDFPNVSTVATWDERIAACDTVDQLKAVRSEARVAGVPDDEWKEKYFPAAKAKRDAILAQEQSA